MDPVAAERSTTTPRVTVVDLHQLSEAEQWPALTGGGLETAVLWVQLPRRRLVLDALVAVGCYGPSDLKVTEAEGLAAELLADRYRQVEVIRGGLDAGDERALGTDVTPPVGSSTDR